jgi:cytochrome c oxidase assembly factor CtaG
VGADYSWTFNPGPILGVAAILVLYLRRWRAVRASDGARGAPTWRLVSFCAGALMVLAALVSPVDALSDQLAVAHMFQHILLLDFAPILFILGLTRTLLRPVTRRVHRIERAAGPLAHPAFAVLAYTGSLWFWHLSSTYNAALEHSGWHVLEHVSFALAGSLYWWHLLSPIRSRFPLAGVGPVIYMATTKVAVGMLGIVLTFSSSVFYDYAGRARIWGLSALDDQNVAGAFMALEQGIVMGVALAVLFARALAQSERDQQRAERYEQA